MQLISERAYARLVKALDDARQDANEQRAYNRVLVQSIVDMRRDGFVSPPVPAARTAEAQRRAGIEETIAMISGGNKHGAMMTRAWVASQRAAGIDDEEIQHALLQPLPDEGEGVPV